MISSSKLLRDVLAARHQRSVSTPAKELSDKPDTNALLRRIIEFSAKDNTDAVKRALHGDSAINDKKEN